MTAVIGPDGQIEDVHIGVMLPRNWNGQQIHKTTKCNVCTRSLIPCI